MGGCVERCVAFLDDDADLRSTMVELLELEYHRPCIPIASHSDLVAKSGAILGCGLAILDVNLGPGAPSGVDSYEWLRAHGFHGRVVFLTGHARTHPLVERAA